MGYHLGGATRRSLVKDFGLWLAITTLCMMVVIGVAYTQTGSFNFPGGLSVPATDRIYLDGGSDTYLLESSANVAQVVTGGGLGLQFQADGIVLAATDRVYLDGGSDSYIAEAAGNQIDITVGGVRAVGFNTSGLFVDPGDNIYLDSGGDTYLDENTPNEVRLVGGGVQVAAFNSTTATINAGTFNTAGVITENGVSVPNVNDNLSVFAATSSAQLAGVLSDENGSGSVAFNISPTFTTPNIGVATASSLVMTGSPLTVTSQAHTSIASGGTSVVITNAAGGYIWMNDAGNNSGCAWHIAAGSGISQVFESSDICDSGRAASKWTLEDVGGNYQLYNGYATAQSLTLYIMRLE